MADKRSRLVNVVLSGLLTGNELGTRLVVHPALDRLPHEAQVAAEQAIVRDYGRVMPVLMSAAMGSAIPVLSRTPNRRSPAFRLTLAGVACQGAMLGVTLLGNVPINRAILAFVSGSPEAFGALRRRWDRLHTARVALDGAGFVLVTLGALSDQAG